MTTADEIMSDLSHVKREVSDLKTEFSLLRRVLIGSYDTPGGMAVTVEKNRADINEIRAQFSEYRAQREQLVKDYDARLTSVEDWIAAMKNRAIGIGIGIGLGSAGIGALVAQLFGG